jgi:hypothetical protein
LSSRATKPACADSCCGFCAISGIPAQTSVNDAAQQVNVVALVTLQEPFFRPQTLLLSL